MPAASTERPPIRALKALPNLGNGCFQFLCADGYLRHIWLNDSTTADAAPPSPGGHEEGAGERHGLAVLEDGQVPFVPQGLHHHRDDGRPLVHPVVRPDDGFTVGVRSAAVRVAAPVIRAAFTASLGAAFVSSMGFSIVSVTDRW